MTTWTSSPRRKVCKKAIELIDAILASTQDRTNWRSPFVAKSAEKLAEAFCELFPEENPEEESSHA